MDSTIRKKFIKWVVGNNNTTDREIELYTEKNPIADYNYWIIMSTDTRMLLLIQQELEQRLENLEDLRNLD